MLSLATSQAIAIVKELVSVDTSDPLVSNRTLIALIAQWVAPCPWIKMQTLPDLTGRHQNVILSVGDTSVPGVVLSGHIDVVAADAATWSTVPFKPFEKDGRLYGRGTTDMKGFVGCALAMLIALVERPLPYPVYLVLTCDEETTMLEASRVIDQLLQQAAKPALAIIGEPTGMNIATHHRGIIEQEATFHGYGVHVSQPERGINTVHMASDVIQLLRQMQMPADGQDWKSIVNVGPVHGGHTNNIVPDQCVLAFDCRMTDDAHGQKMVQEVRALCDDLETRYSLPDRAASVTIDTICHTPPLRKPSYPVAQERVARQLQGLYSFAQDRQFPGATEAGFFDQMGIPAIVMGPGHLEQAHISDEYVAIEQLDRCCAVLERILSADLLADGKK